MNFERFLGDMPSLLEGERVRVRGGNAIHLPSRVRQTPFLTTPHRRFFPAGFLALSPLTPVLSPLRGEGGAPHAPREALRQLLQ